MAKITHQQKLDALAYRFYQGGAWIPKAGDFYTTSRADLELYQVVSVEGGVVRTRFTEGSDAIAEWPEGQFLTGGFGPKRVFVPEWVLCAKPPTIPEGKWGWWAGNNEEWFTVGPCASREDVIADATSECLGETDDSGEWKLTFCITEAKQDPLSFGEWIDFDKLIEFAEDSIMDSDRVGEEDDTTIFSITPEQQNDLEARIKRACVEWQLANNLTFKTTLFSHQRSTEFVTVDHPHPVRPAPDTCPICTKPLNDDDICASDIEMGICHAACLEGSPTVDLEAGEPSDGPIDTFRYGDTAPKASGGERD